MLVLPIKKKWFDMIASGEKKEEYREIKPYYDVRLLQYFNYSVEGVGVFKPDGKETKMVIFRNGYSKKAPQIKCVCTLDMGVGKEEWRCRRRQEILYFKD